MVRRVYPATNLQALTCARSRIGAHPGTRRHATFVQHHTREARQTTTINGSSSAASGTVSSRRRWSPETRVRSRGRALSDDHDIGRAADYPEGVTAAAANHGPNQDPGRFDSPRAIRAALLPEEVGDFDAAYQQALRSASETLSLEALQATLESWRRIAQMTQADPAGHRQMLEQAKRTLRTGELPKDAMDWEQFRTELGV